MITVPALYLCGYCGVTTTSECGFCSKACRVDELLDQPLIHPESGGRPSPVRRSPVAG